MSQNFVLFFTVTELIWGCPWVNLIAGWLYYSGEQKDRFDHTKHTRW